MAKKKLSKDSIIWCNRGVVLAPYFGLVLTEADFHEQLRRAGIPLAEHGAMVNDGAHATCHSYRNQKGRLCCLVALKGWEEQDAMGIVGLLVHEAVHIWQRMCQDIGEKDPSMEFEAYSIQAISQELMISFSEQTNYGQTTP